MAAIFAVGACGGGGGDNDSTTASTPASRPQTVTTPAFNATTPAGIWSGTTSTGREVTKLVQADGTYWLVYSKVGDASILAGAVQGTAASNNGVLVSTDGLDFHVEAATVGLANLTSSPP